MDRYSLEKIYYKYENNKIDASDLLVYLSLWDEKDEESSEELLKRVRLKRTFITEINRYLTLKGKCRAEKLFELSLRYMKEYLYRLAAEKKKIEELTFQQFIEDYIDGSSILKNQYLKIKNEKEFWNTILDIDAEILRLVLEFKTFDNNS